MSRTPKRASDLMSDSSRTPNTGLNERLISVRGSARQEDQATKFGVHLNTYARWERGGSEPDASQLVVLVNEGWNANWLLTGDGPERLDALFSGTFDASHDLSEEHLSIAMQLADKKIKAERRNPSYDQYARFVALIYEGITKGLPEADIFDIRPGEQKPMRRPKDDDSEGGVGSES